jgi:hypothetical protein
MKSVVNERARARRLVIGAAFASVVVGFVACSGSTEHKASPHVSAGGDASEAGAHQGGSESTAAGETGLGGQAVAGAGVGGASGGVGAEAGVGGEIAQGGQALAGAGGATVGGEGGGGGAGGEAPFVDPVCGVNMVQVGAYSLWCGKVNEHKDANGDWQPDADCSSGCNVKGVPYCQKFYPTATAIVDVPQVDIKDWKNGGFASGQSGPCNDSAPDSVGISGQAACCAPVN